MGGGHSVAMQADWLRETDQTPAAGDYRGSALIHIGADFAGDSCPNLLPIVDSFFDPPTLSVTGALGDGYDPGTGFYQIDAAGASTVTIDVGGSLPTAAFRLVNAGDQLPVVLLDARLRNGGEYFADLDSGELIVFGGAALASGDTLRLEFPE
jgi:hypothetical protein